MLTMLIFPMGAAMAFLMVAFAFMAPSTDKARARRVGDIRARHGGINEALAQEKARRIATTRDTKLDSFAHRLLPKPDQLRQRLAKTGRDWTIGQYLMVCGGIATVELALGIWRGAPVLLVLFAAVASGVGLPHKILGMLIKRRLTKFNAKFPDAIELLVRGLRSGLPITETLGVVASEVPGPVGEEFRLITDRIRIGRTMEAALQETADRLGTPEFQFFVITLAIQRETGGNLAETLSNLADVLRKRAQMKLKIKAMSSESKASAYIVGSLPFFVFGIIYFMNGNYMQKFFTEPRLIVAGLCGLVWMGIGAFVMAKMVSFEI